jgi:hypothetical protein
MNINLSRSNKTLVIGIVIIFIGTGISQNICGYEKLSNIKVIKDAKSSFILNDDFINAFWKFNECSGDTVGDSSGNNYDGIRNGSTWITDGYSGCALEFDGIDDYVDLNSYAAEIGVNKTDDFIISFYFKSNSTKNGIIFSNRGYDNKPELIIELESNGRLSFKIWTHCKCGLVVFSDNGYNDGLWHKVDIFYNGISLKPTILMFIDDNLKGNLTDWICEVESINFTKAAIGKMTFFDSDFFNGIVDEFKFIKYERGNDQEPPIIDGPKIGKPDKDYDYTFTTNDPENDDVWIQIDWGDGEVTDWMGPYESGETVTVSHRWTEENIYYIRARSKDFWDESHWSIEDYEVKIGNQPPDKPIVSGPLYGESGEEICYNFTAYDLEGHDISYIIDWGDGTTTETDYEPSNTSIGFCHIWDFNNDYNITASAIDINGKVSELSEPLWIRIGDKPPRKTDIDGPASGLSREEIDFVFEAIDPENDNICFNIRWGDGEEILESDWYTSGTQVTFSHSWDTTGTFLIEARAKDIFGYWSDWSSFNIKIPRQREVNFHLMRFLGQFPIIEKLLQIIKPY